MISEDLKKAARLIKNGSLAAFPTETVYGLGADASKDEACLSIYEAKGRPSFNPLIIHVHSLASAERIAEFDEKALKIAEAFWPGPLTLVLKLKDGAGISKIATAGLGTVGVRIPSHEKALALLAETGAPVAAPSANISGYVSPTEASHVEKDFGKNLFVLDGGKSVRGIESTILDLSEGKPSLLRSGFIGKDSLEKFLGEEISDIKGGKIKAPGATEKHYSPKSPLRLNATSLMEGEIGLDFGKAIFSPTSLNLSPSADLVEAAANLYSFLRLLDEEAGSKGRRGIAVAPIPNTGLGAALNDRLSRASFI